MAPLSQLSSTIRNKARDYNPKNGNCMRGLEQGGGLTVEQQGVGPL